MKLLTSKKVYFTLILLVFLSYLIIFPRFTRGQANENASRQQRSKKLRLIEKSDQKPTKVGHITFDGNVKVRDRDFLENIKRYLSPGEIFSRRNLNLALKNLSQMKAIHPVHLENVKVGFNEEENEIDLTITVREKRHSK